jgi:Ca2+-binding RTX toxin-like protein
VVSFDRVDYAGTGNCAPPTTCGTPGGVNVIPGKGANDSLALTTSGIGVGWSVRLTFAQPTQRLTLLVGDADQAPGPGATAPRAVLTGFFNGVRVASVSVQGDLDSLANQSLNLQGSVINSAVVQWANANGTPREGWPEIVDNVHSDPLCSVFGNNGPNTLNGTVDIDVLCGGGGGDTLNGFGDHDLLFGNGGTDTLNGGAGMDQMFGGTGNDTCNGGTGTDTANSCETRTSVP